MMTPLPPNEDQRRLNGVDRNEAYRAMQEIVVPGVVRDAAATEVGRHATGREVPARTESRRSGKVTPLNRAMPAECRALRGRPA